MVGGRERLMMVTLFLGGFTEAVIRAGPGTASVLVSTPPFSSPSSAGNSSGNASASLSFSG